jgi:hypothetical protein
VRFCKYGIPVSHSTGNDQAGLQKLRLLAESLSLTTKGALDLQTWLLLV